MVLKKWIPVLILVLSSLANAATRDESLNKLYQLQGWGASTEQQNTAVRDGFAKQLTAATDEIGKAYTLTDDDKKKIEQINNQYLDAVSHVDTFESGRDFWKQYYGQTFTDAELEALVKEGETPLDRKATVASLLASKKLGERYDELSNSIRDKALLDYSKAIKSVLAQCGCKNTHATLAQTAAADEATSNLVVSGVVERKVGKQVYFTGMIKNNGEKPIHAQVLLNFFKNGEFVDQQIAIVPLAVLPNGSQYFKLDCRCTKATMAPYDSFKALPSKMY